MRSAKCLLNYSIDCSSLPGLKRTALPGGMETSAPVRGLRPMPVLRGCTLKTPNPRSSMRSPVRSEFLHAFEDRLDRHFRFGLGDAGAVDDFVNDVQLDHVRLFAWSLGLPQVLDAKEHNEDCQRAPVSRKMLVPACTD